MQDTQRGVQRRQRKWGPDSNCSMLFKHPSRPNIGIQTQYFTPVYMCVHTQTHTAFNFKKWLALQISPASRGYYPVVPIFLQPLKGKSVKKLGLSRQPRAELDTRPLPGKRPCSHPGLRRETSTGHLSGVGFKFISPPHPIHECLLRLPDEPHARTCCPHMPWLSLAHMGGVQASRTKPAPLLDVTDCKFFLILSSTLPTRNFSPRP